MSNPLLDAFGFVDETEDSDPPVATSNPLLEDFGFVELEEPSLSNEEVSFYENYEPNFTEFESVLSEEPTVENLNKFYGYTEAPQIETPVDPVRGSFAPLVEQEPSRRVQLTEEVFSDSKERNYLIGIATQKDLDPTSQMQAVRSYVKSIVNEASGSPGYRPKDREFEAEQNENYKRYAIETSSSGEEAEEKYSKAKGEAFFDGFDNFSFGSPMGMSKKEYANKLFFNELLKAPFTKEQKKEAIQYFNSIVDEDVTSSMEDITNALMYDVSKIRTLDPDSPLMGGESTTADVLKLTGGFLNTVGGLIGIVASSASAPFVSDKYYMKDEKPLSPDGNFIKLNSAASDVFEWNSSEDVSEQDPYILSTNFIETGDTTVNDRFFKKVAEVSNRGKRVPTGVGSGVPFYSSGDVIRIVDDINKNKEAIKKELEKVIFLDPSHKYDIAKLPKGQDRIAFIQNSRETKEFQDLLESKFQAYSASLFAEDEFLDKFSSVQRKYANAFQKYFPKETESSKAAESISKAQGLIFESDTPGKENMAALNELLSTVPQEYREEYKKILLGIEVAKSAFGFGETASIAPVVLTTQDRINLFNTLAIQYAQRSEVKQISEMAKDGLLGDRWSGKNIKGTPAEIKKRKEILHSAAPHMLMIESMSTNPVFSSTVDSYYTNVSASLMETPFQMAVPFILMAPSLGLDVPEDLLKASEELYSRDPALVYLNFAAGMGLIGKLAKKGLRANFSGPSFAKDPVGAVKNAIAQASDGPIPVSPKEALVMADDSTSMSPIAQMEKFDSGKNQPYSKPVGAVTVSPETTIGQFKKKIQEIDLEIESEKSLPEASQSEQKIKSLELQKTQTEKLLNSREEFRAGRMMAEASEDKSLIVDVAEITDDTVERFNRSNLADPDFAPDKVLKMAEPERIEAVAKTIQSKLDVIDENYKSNFDEALKDATYGRNETSRILAEYDIPNLSGKNLKKAVNALVLEEIDDFRVWKYVLDSSGNPYIKRDNASVARSISIVRNKKIKTRRSARTKIIQSIDQQDFQRSKPTPVPIRYVEGLQSASSDRPVAARTDRKNNRILIDKAQVRKTFDNKAWTKAQVEGVRAFKEDAFKTIQEWELFLIEHERAHFSLRNQKIPRGAKRENDANAIAYSAVIESRKPNSSINRQKEKGPYSIISDETRSNPSQVKNRFDSLAIADEISSKGGDSPDLYYGLNLSDREVMGFVETGKQRKSTASAVVAQKNAAKDYSGPFTGRVEYLDQGDRFTPEFSPTPPTIYGTKQVSLIRSLLRGVGRTLFGNDIFKISDAQAKQKKVRFAALAAAEIMTRPFAVVNIPGYFKNIREELFAHAIHSGKYDKTVLGKSFVKVLDFFNSDSAAIGLDDFYAFRAMEGENTFKLNKMLSDAELKGSFEITDSLIQKYFSTVKELESRNMLRTFDSLELHEIGSVVSRMSDAFITDKSTGKRYKFSDYAEIRVDATKFFKKKLNLVENRIAALVQEKSQSAFSVPGVRRARLNYLQSQRAELSAKLNSGDVVVPMRDLQLDLVPIKNELTALLEKTKDFESPTIDQDKIAISVLRDRLNIAYNFDNKVVLNSVKDPKYYPTVPISSLDEFQKSTFIIANEFVKPKRDIIFDLVSQIIAGEDTARLMFKDSFGFENNVVRILPDGKYQVLERFTPDQKGEVRAKAYASKSRDPISEKVGADKDIPGSIVVKSDDFLAQKFYLQNRATKITPLKTKRLFDPDTANILDQTLTYVSDYFDTSKVLSFLEDSIKSLTNDPSFSTQAEFNKAGLSILTAIDGGMRLLKENNYDVKQTMTNILSMSKTEQKAFLGKILTTEERFFFEKSFERAFTADQLLSMYSNYQASFIKTVTGLHGTLGTLRLQNHIRSRGMLLSASEVNALPESVSSQFIFVEDVKTKKGSPVFPSTMQGAYINRRVAKYFERQAILQEVVSDNPFVDQLQQITKTGLVIDVINNSIARNLYSALLVQGMLHAEIPVNPAYYVKTAKLVRDLSSGKLPEDPKVLRILKTYSTDTSIRRDIKYTRGQQIINELIESMYQHSSDTRVIDKIEKADTISDENLIKTLKGVFSLKDNKIKAKVNAFIEKMKTEDIDAEVQSQLDPTDVQRLRNVGSGLLDFLLSLQSKPDLVAKIAYTWQLEDAGYKPSLAYAESLRTFIDYVDVPSYINFFRYGGGLSFGGSAFSFLTSDFITFASAQSKNNWNAITNNPLRAAIFANISQANDKALEETLKLKRSISEIRSLKGDPTYNFLPGYTVQEAVGSEYGDQRSYLGGAAGYSGSLISGATVFSFDPTVFYSNVPRNPDQITGTDINRAIKHGVVSQMGGYGNAAYEATFKNASAAKQDKLLQNELIEKGVIEGTALQIPETTGIEGAIRVLATRFNPRIIRSFVSLFDKSKRKDRIVGQLLGFTVEPFDFRGVPVSRLKSAKYFSNLNKTYKAIQKARSENRNVDDNEAQKIVEELNSISFKLSQDVSDFTADQQDMFLYTEVILMGKLLTGEITYDEINQFRLSYPE